MIAPRQMQLSYLRSNACGSLPGDQDVLSLLISSTCIHRNPGEQDEITNAIIYNCYIANLNKAVEQPVSIVNNSDVTLATKCQDNKLCMQKTKSSFKRTLFVTALLEQYTLQPIKDTECSIGVSQFLYNRIV